MRILRKPSCLSFSQSIIRKYFHLLKCTTFISSVILYYSTFTCSIREQQRWWLGPIRSPDHETFWWPDRSEIKLRSQSIGQGQHLLHGPILMRQGQGQARKLVCRLMCGSRSTKARKRHGCSYTGNRCCSNRAQEGFVRLVGTIKVCSGPRVWQMYDMGFAR